MTNNTGDNSKYNGYVNGPKLVSQALTKNGKPKKFKHWLESKDAKNKIKELKKMVGDIPVNVEIAIGGTSTNNLVSGTYVHPKLVIHLACWMSPIFSFKLSDWVEEWRSWSKENDAKYLDALQDICNDMSNLQLGTEEEIQLDLQSKLPNSKIEVDTPVGRIDILTDNEIIEIKKASKWKHAVGQILMYSKYYPDHQKVIYLFDTTTTVDITLIQSVVSEYGIKIKTIE